MTSPGRWPSRRPSIPNMPSYHDEAPYPVPTRSGALASLIRSRSTSSLSVKYRPASQPHQAQDEETAHLAASSNEDDITRLLANEQRLSQILHGPQARSMNLIGKSNPRYRWEKYWTREEELQTLSKPL